MESLNSELSTGSEPRAHRLLGGIRISVYRIGVGVLAVAAVLSWVVWRGGLDLERVAGLLREVQWGYVVLALAAYYGSFPLRAWRWQLLLARSSSSLSPPAAPRLVLPYLYGWLVNCLTPAKLGEMYRCYHVHRRFGLPFLPVVSSALVERAADLLLLSCLLPTTVLLTIGLHSSHQLLLLQGIAFALTLLILGSLVVLRWASPLLQRLPTLVRQPAATLAAGLAVPSRTLLVACFLTFPLWLFEGLRVYAESQALGLSFGFTLSLLIALVAALLTTLPLTPAGIGAVELGIAGTMVLLGFPLEQAIGLSLLDRLVAYWSVFLVAGPAWLADYVHGR